MRKGEARKGEARKGEARKGEARKGPARKGPARKGEARKRARFTLAALVAITAHGCAEGAWIAPAVRVEARALRSTSAGSDIVLSERWSWAVGAALIGAIDPPAISSPPEPRPPPGLSRRIAPPCRVPAVCAWEARARARALARAMRLARDGEAP